MYSLAPVLVLLAGLILIVRLQTLSPPGLVEPYALWHRTQELLEQPVPAYVSAEASRPWVALGAPLGMFLGFIAAFVNATDRARARLLFNSIAVSAAAYAAYGIFAYIFNPASLLWAEKQVFLTSVTGTISGVMTILVGDYVDRGPESKSAIDYLASDQFFPTPTIALRGNHDEVLLAFLADPRTGDLWRRMGGVETLHSYGVNVPTSDTARTWTEPPSASRADSRIAHRILVRAANTFRVGRVFFLSRRGTSGHAP